MIQVIGFFLFLTQSVFFVFSAPLPLPPATFKWSQTLSHLHMSITTSSSACDRSASIIYDISMERFSIHCFPNQPAFLSFEFHEDIQPSDESTRCSSADQPHRHKCVFKKQHPGHFFDHIASLNDRPKLKSIASVDWDRWITQDDDENNEEREEEEEGEEGMDKNKNKNKKGDKNTVVIHNMTQYDTLLEKNDALIIWSEYKWCRTCKKEHRKVYHNIVRHLERKSDRAMDIPTDSPFYPMIQSVRIDPMVHRALARTLNVSCNIPSSLECTATLVPGRRTLSDPARLLKKVETLPFYVHSDAAKLAQQVRRFATPIVISVKALDTDYVLQRFGGHVLLGYPIATDAQRFYNCCANLHKKGGGGIGMTTASTSSTSISRAVCCMHMLERPISMSTLKLEESRAMLMVRTKNDYELVPVPTLETLKQSMLMLKEEMKEEEDNDNDNDKGDIQRFHQWIQRTTIPIMQELNWQVRDALSPTNLPLILLIMNDEGTTVPIGTNGDTASVNVPSLQKMARDARELTRQVIKKYRGQVACVFQTKMASAYHLDKYGFVPPIGKLPFPLLVIFDTPTSESLYYALKINSISISNSISDSISSSPLTPDNVLQHVDRYFGGELAATRKTLRVPESWSPGHVKAIVYDTLSNNLEVETSVHDEILLVFTKNSAPGKMIKKLRSLLARTATSMKHMSSKVVVAVYDTASNYFHEDMFPHLDTQVDRHHTETVFVYVTQSPPKMSVMRRRKNKKIRVPSQAELNKFIWEHTNVLKEEMVVEMEIQPEMSEIEHVVDADADATATGWDLFVTTNARMLHEDQDFAQKKEEERKKMEMEEELLFEKEMTKRGTRWTKKELVGQVIDAEKENDSKMKKGKKKKKKKKTTGKRKGNDEASDSSRVLKYILTTASTTGTDEHKKRPQIGSQVHISYVGKSLNGTIIDTNGDDPDFMFIAGQQQVIECWDRGVMSMIVGETAIFHCPWRTAWGENGIKNKILPRTTMLYEIKLLAVE